VISSRSLPPRLSGVWKESSLGQPANGSGDGRAGSDLGQQVFDLTLAPMSRAPQEIGSVLRREVRDELGDPGQMKTPVAKHLQELRMLPCGPRRRDPQVGLGLREVEHVDAVRKHRGRSHSSEEPAPVHLADMGDELGLGPAGLSEKDGQTTEQLVVRDPCERRIVFHGERVRLTQDKRGPTDESSGRKTRSPRSL
jgi:hypothetical protein